MLRLVKDFVPAPHFMILCDKTTCAQTISTMIPDGAPIDGALTAFVEVAKMGGWSIGLFGTVCPAHTKEAQQGVSKLVAPSRGLSLVEH